MLTENGLAIIANICVFLLLLIPLVVPKWIFRDDQSNFFYRLKFGAIFLLILSAIIYFCNSTLESTNRLKQDAKDSVNANLAKDLRSLKDQLPPNGLFWDSAKNIVRSLYGNPVVVYKDTTNDNTDVVLCATDQMKLEIKNREKDSIWITANFCTTRAEVKGFSIYDNVLVKRGNDILVNKTDPGITNQNWQYGTHDFSAISFNLEAPYTLNDTIIYYCRFNWANKSKGNSSGPKRLMLVWHNEIRQFGFLTNPGTMEAVKEALQKFHIY